MKHGPHSKNQWMKLLTFVKKSVFLDSWDKKYQSDTHVFGIIG